jgi:hypothetical protein
MRSLDKLLLSRLGPILTGCIAGVLAALLVAWGNPGNMGICVACFTRDIAGGLGLHRAAVVQYLRPEIAGLILGAFGSALLFREFRPRSGSSPLVRFFLGFFAMVGALVFLGCPWRAYLRLAGGCPGRQLILSGEGDGDAGIFVLGMLVGAGFAHNFSLASSASGPSPYGPTAVAIGLVFCLATGFLMRERLD